MNRCGKLQEKQLFTTRSPIIHPWDYTPTAKNHSSLEGEASTAYFCRRVRKMVTEVPMMTDIGWSSKKAGLATTNEAQQGLILSSSTRAPYLVRRVMRNGKVSTE
jgi:hypothetical protein